MLRQWHLHRDCSLATEALGPHPSPMQPNLKEVNAIKQVTEMVQLWKWLQSVEKFLYIWQDTKLLPRPNI